MHAVFEVAVVAFEGSFLYSLHCLHGTVEEQVICKPVSTMSAITKSDPAFHLTASDNN